MRFGADGLHHRAQARCQAVPVAALCEGRRQGRLQDLLHRQVGQGTLQAVANLQSRQASVHEYKQDGAIVHVLAPQPGLLGGTDGEVLDRAAGQVRVDHYGNLAGGLLLKCRQQLVEAAALVGCQDMAVVREEARQGRDLGRRRLVGIDAHRRVEMIEPGDSHPEHKEPKPDPQQREIPGLAGSGRGRAAGCGSCHVSGFIVPVASGSRTVASRPRTWPRSSRLSSWMLPPSASTISRQIVRPSPLPEWACPAANGWNRR